MIPEDNYEKIKMLADVITEEEVEPYRQYFIRLGKEAGPKNCTILKSLRKFPSPNSPGGFAYEYELSDFYKAFLLFMEFEFEGRNQDVKYAIIHKIISTHGPGN